MKVYLNEAATKLDVSIDVLKKARSMPEYTRFFNQGRVDHKGLKPFVAELKKLEKEEPESSDYWKRRKLKADAQVSEIELDEMRKKFLDKDEVIVLLKQIATAQRSLLKTRLVHELPSKLLGLNVTEMSVIMEKELQDILQIFQTSIELWTK